MQELLPIAQRIGAKLQARRETVAIFESSTGGLVSAALLAVPGASAYFLGGGVIYTRQARAAIAGIEQADMQSLRPATEPYALLLARQARSKLEATWGIGESGASGPTGNRYGDMPGHACLAVAGPSEISVTLETASNDRVANMRRFARGMLELLERALTAD
jgi:PncC family amidohydrolase